jgi:hypothetical protein
MIMKRHHIKENPVTITKVLNVENNVLNDVIVIAKIDYVPGTN